MHCLTYSLLIKCIENMRLLHSNSKDFYDLPRTMGALHLMIKLRAVYANH